jgi:hypothetical protein
MLAQYLEDEAKFAQALLPGACQAHPQDALLGDRLQNIGRHFEEALHRENARLVGAADLDSLLVAQEAIAIPAREVESRHAGLFGCYTPHLPNT